MAAAAGWTERGGARPGGGGRGRERPPHRPWPSCRRRRLRAPSLRRPVPTARAVRARPGVGVDGTVDGQGGDRQPAGPRRGASGNCRRGDRAVPSRRDGGGGRAATATSLGAIAVTTPLRPEAAGGRGPPPCLGLRRPSSAETASRPCERWPPSSASTTPPERPEPGRQGRRTDGHASVGPTACSWWGTASTTPRRSPPPTWAAPSAAGRRRPWPTATSPCSATTSEGCRRPSASPVDLLGHRAELRVGHGLQRLRPAPGCLRPPRPAGGGGGHGAVQPDRGAQQPAAHPLGTRPIGWPRRCCPPPAGVAERWPSRSPSRSSSSPA